MSADPRTCAATRVVHPAIQLVKKAPAEVLICDPIPMTLTVKNTGSSGLTAVKVNDPLPAGLTSDGKSSLAFDAGNLAPGESKEFKFNATAAKTGEFVNKATASSAQGVKAEASSTTVVREPVLTVACTAPEQRYMGRPFDVTFTVANKGDTAAAGTVLEVPVPDGLTAKSASNGGQVSAQQDRLGSGFAGGECLAEGDGHVCERQCRQLPVQPVGQGHLRQAGFLHLPDSRRGRGRPSCSRKRTTRIRSGWARRPPTRLRSPTRAAPTTTT